MLVMSGEPKIKKPITYNRITARQVVIRDTPLFQRVLLVAFIPLTYPSLNA